MMREAITHLKRLFIPQSLRYQLITRSLYILSVLLLLIGVMQYWLMKDFVYRNKAETMVPQIRALPRELIDMGDMNALGSNRMKDREQEPPLTRRPLLFLPDTTLAFIDRKGSFTDISGEYSNGEVSPRLSQQEYIRILHDWPVHEDFVYKVVQLTDGSEQLMVFLSWDPRGQTKGFIQMSTGTSTLQDVMVRQLLTFILLSFFALLSGLLVTWPVIRRTLQPLSSMISAVERTDAGNLSERLPINQGQEEIDRLSNSFNHMLERLDASFQTEREAKEQMRQFIADASHELRTPLTSIHGFLEVLLRGAADNPEQLYRALNSMRGESSRIIKLVEDLLLLAKLDRAPQLNETEARLDVIIREMEPQLLVLAGNRKVHFDIMEQVSGRFDVDKIKQLILNLFHNAVQHTDPIQGEIHLKLLYTATDVELIIQDNGTGITKEHLDRIFERFYRNEPSRTRRTGGAGLGLSISKSIVEAHGGVIRVDSELHQGSTFTITLPRSRGSQ